MRRVVMAVRRAARQAGNDSAKTKEEIGVSKAAAKGQESEGKKNIAPAAQTAGSRLKGRTRASGLRKSEFGARRSLWGQTGGNAGKKGKIQRSR